MKVNELIESSKEMLKKYSDKDLIKMAREIGEKLYGDKSKAGRTGLIFDPSIKHITYQDYIGSSDAGPIVDTFDYVFFPSSGKGVDAADMKFSKKHVDIDGKIYIAGANGVKVLSEPFKIKKLPFPIESLEPFRKAVLKHFPNARFTKRDKWDRVFAYDNKEMVGQFCARNDFTTNNGLPSWLVSRDLKTLEKHNW